MNFLHAMNHEFYVNDYNSFVNMPDIVIGKIFEHLNRKDRLHLAMTCRTFYQYYRQKEPIILKDEYMRNQPLYAHSELNLSGSEIAFLTLANESFEKLTHYDKELIKNAKALGFATFAYVRDTFFWANLCPQELYDVTFVLINKYLVKKDFKALIINLCLPSTLVEKNVNYDALARLHHKKLSPLYTLKKDSSDVRRTFPEALKNYSELNPTGRPIIVFYPYHREQSGHNIHSEEKPSHYDHSVDQHTILRFAFKAVQLNFLRDFLVCRQPLHKKISDLAALNLPCVEKISTGYDSKPFAITNPLLVYSSSLQNLKEKLKFLSDCLYELPENNPKTYHEQHAKILRKAIACKNDALVFLSDKNSGAVAHMPQAPWTDRAIGDTQYQKSEKCSFFDVPIFSVILDAHADTPDIKNSLNTTILYASEPDRPTYRHPYHGSLFKKTLAEELAKLKSRETVSLDTFYKNARECVRSATLNRGINGDIQSPQLAQYGIATKQKIYITPENKGDKDAPSKTLPGR